MPWVNSRSGEHHDKPSTRDAQLTSPRFSVKTQAETETVWMRAHFSAPKIASLLIAAGNGGVGSRFTTTTAKTTAKTV